MGIAHFFYNELIKNEFSDAHLTDVLKVRLTTDQAKPYIRYIRQIINNQTDSNSDMKQSFSDAERGYINKQLNYLKEEFEIINPKLAVILGTTDNVIQSLLESSIINYQGRIEKIYHYSYADGAYGERPERRKRFLDDMAKIKELYNKLKI